MTILSKRNRFILLRRKKSIRKIRKKILMKGFQKSRKNQKFTGNSQTKLGKRYLKEKKSSRDNRKFTKNYRKSKKSSKNRENSKKKLNKRKS